MFGTINRVISLGNWCSTKATINLYLNPRQKWSKTPKGHADLFDWMLIGDYDYLATAITNNLDELFEKKDLIKMDNIFTPTGEIVIVNGIYNAKHKMIWPHLFDSLSGFDLNSSREALFDGNDEIFQTVKSKINYLREKFISAHDKRTLYVITYDDHIDIPEIVRPQKPSFDTIVKIRNALRHMRKNDNFILLFITANQITFMHENIIATNNENTKCFFDNVISEDSQRIFGEFSYDLLPKIVEEEEVKEEVEEVKEEEVKEEVEVDEPKEEVEEPKVEEPKVDEEAVKVEVEELKVEEQKEEAKVELEEQKEEVQEEVQEEVEEPKVVVEDQLVEESMVAVIVAVELEVAEE